MNPCPFVRLLIGNLAIKLPVASCPAGSGVHPSSTPCFCKITLQNFSFLIAPTFTNAYKGGCFSIDFAGRRGSGFVMSSNVGGEGRVEVQVGVQHVVCAEDAAAFVALAAAVDLSVDACRLFSEKEWKWRGVAGGEVDGGFM